MALPSCTSLPFKAIDMWSIGQEPRLCHNSGRGSECERERLPVCWFILRDVHLHRAAFWCSLRKIDDDVSYYGFLPVYLFDSETSSWNSTAVFLFHLFHWSMKALEVPDGSGPSSLADLSAQAASLQKCSGEIFLASFRWKHIDDGKSTDRYSLRHLRHFQIREWPIYTAELVHFSISWSFHVELTYVCPQFSIIPCEGGKQNHLLAENDIYIYVVSCCKLLRVVFWVWGGSRCSRERTRSISWIWSLAIWASRTLKPFPGPTPKTMVQWCLSRGFHWVRILEHPSFGWRLKNRAFWVCQFSTLCPSWHQSARIKNEKCRKFLEQPPQPATSIAVHTKPRDVLCSVSMHAVFTSCS